MLSYYRVRSLAKGEKAMIVRIFTGLSVITSLLLLSWTMIRPDAYPPPFPLGSTVGVQFASYLGWVFFTLS